VQQKVKTFFISAVFVSYVSYAEFYVGKKRGGGGVFYESKNV